MQLPRTDASIDVRLAYARGLSGRLLFDGHLALSDRVEAATTALLGAVRAVQDQEGPVQRAVAIRDAADGALDGLTRRVRAQLAARELDAVKEAPYLDIFPKRIGYYTRARLMHQTQRYTELIGRLDAALDDDDDVRTTCLPALRAGIEAWQAAVDDVEAARVALALARTTRDTLTDAWALELERVYGLLVTELGKRRAERFFPRVRTRRAPTSTLAEDDAAPEPSPPDGAPPRHPPAPEAHATIPDPPPPSPASAGRSDPRRVPARSTPDPTPARQRPGAHSVPRDASGSERRRGPTPPGEGGRAPP